MSYVTPVARLDGSRKEANRKVDNSFQMGIIDVPVVAPRVQKRKVSMRGESGSATGVGEGKRWTSWVERRMSTLRSLTQRRISLENRQRANGLDIPFDEDLVKGKETELDTSLQRSSTCQQGPRSKKSRTRKRHADASKEVQPLHAQYPLIAEKFTHSLESLISSYSQSFYELLTIFTEFHALSKNTETPVNMMNYIQKQMRGIFPEIFISLISRHLPTEQQSFPCPEMLVDYSIVEACTTVAVINEASEYYARMIQRLGFNLHSLLEKVQYQDTATTHIWKQQLLLIDKIGLVSLSIHQQEYSDHIIHKLNTLIEIECAGLQKGISKEEDPGLPHRVEYHTEQETMNIEHSPMNSKINPPSKKEHTITQEHILHPTPSYIMLYNNSHARSENTDFLMDVSLLIASDGYVVCNISIDNTLLYGIIQAGEYILEEIMQEKVVQQKRSVLQFENTSIVHELKETLLSEEEIHKKNSVNEAKTSKNVEKTVTTQKEYYLETPLTAPSPPDNKRHITNNKTDQAEAEFLQHQCVRSITNGNQEVQESKTIPGVIRVIPDLPPRLPSRVHIDTSSGRKYAYPAPPIPEKEHPIHFANDSVREYTRKQSTVENVSAYVMEGSSPGLSPREKKGFFRSNTNSRNASKLDLLQSNSSNVDLLPDTTKVENLDMIAIKPPVLGENVEQVNDVVLQIVKQAAYSKAYLPSRDQNVVLTSQGDVYTSKHIYNEAPTVIDIDDNTDNTSIQPLSIDIPDTLNTSNSVENTSSTHPYKTLDFSPTTTEVPGSFSFAPKMTQRHTTSTTTTTSTTNLSMQNLAQHPVLPQSNITRIGSYKKAPRRPNTQSTIDLLREQQYKEEEERGEPNITSPRSIVSRPGSPFRHNDHGQLVLYNDPLVNADDTHMLHTGVASTTMNQVSTGKITSPYLQGPPTHTQQKGHPSAVLYTMLRGTLLEEAQQPVDAHTTQYTRDDNDITTVGLSDPLGIPQIVVPAETTLQLYTGNPHSILDSVAPAVQFSADEVATQEHVRRLLTWMPVSDTLQEQVDLATGHTIKPPVYIPQHQKYKAPKQTTQYKHQKATNRIQNGIRNASKQPYTPYYMRLATFNSFLHNQILCTKRVRLNAQQNFAAFMSQTHQTVADEMREKMHAEAALENPSVKKEGHSSTIGTAAITFSNSKHKQVDILELLRISNSTEPPTIDMVLQNHGIAKPKETSQPETIQDKKALFVRQMALQKAAVNATERVLARRGTQDEYVDVYLSTKSSDMDAAQTYVAPKLLKNQIIVDTSVITGNTVIVHKGDVEEKNTLVNFSYHRQIPCTDYASDPVLVRRRREERYRAKQVNKAVAYAIEHADSIFEMQDKLQASGVYSGALDLSLNTGIDTDSARKPCVCGRGVQGECPCYRPPIFLDDNTNQNDLLFSRVPIQQQLNSSHVVPIRSYYEDQAKEDDIKHLSKMEATKVLRDVESKKVLQSYEPVTDFNETQKEAAGKQELAQEEDATMQESSVRLGSWHHHTKKKAAQARKLQHKSLGAVERARVGEQKDTVSDTVVNETQQQQILGSSKALQPLVRDQTGKLVTAKSTMVEPTPIVQITPKKKDYQTIDYELQRVPDRLDRMRHRTLDIASFAQQAQERIDGINSKTVETSNIPVLPTIARRKTNNGIHVRHTDQEYLVKSHGYDKRKW